MNTQYEMQGPVLKSNIGYNRDSFFLFALPN